MDSAELQAMLDHDERHWWYRGRRRIVGDTVDALHLPAGVRALDAGCGSGRTLDELAARFGAARVSGIDLSAEGVECARRRGHADVRQGPVEQLPWPDETFDLVLSLDVIEHTLDDRASVRELRRVLKPGGALLLTVPALQALWSAHDVVNHHHRRYDRRMMRTLAGDTGLTIERMTYFNSLLLAPAAAVRVVQRLRNPRLGVEEHRSDLELTPEWASRLLELPLRAEAAWLRHGGGAGALPLGLSLLAVLRRPSGH